MRDHCLLVANGIQPSLVRRIRAERDRRSWVIELKRPREGICPVCGRRSRRVKTHLPRFLQGAGGPGLQVRVLVERGVFYCSHDGCPRSTFLVQPERALKPVGDLLPSVLSLIRKLSFEHGLNNLQLQRLLQDTFGLQVSEPRLRRVLRSGKVQVPHGYAPRHLGIDEHFPKGLPRARGRGRRPQRSRLHLLDLELGVSLASVKGKSAAAARRLLQRTARRVDLSQVRDVTRDLCDDWDPALHDALDRPGRPVVVRVDEFHLLRNLGPELYEKVFVAERMRAPRQGDRATARALFRNRFRFRTRRERLRERDRSEDTTKTRQLDQLLMRFPRLRNPYRLQQALYRLIELGPGDGPRFRWFAPIRRLALRSRLPGLVQRLDRHEPFIRNHLLRPRTRMLPEQTFSKLRAAERARRSFRTERARDRYQLMQLRNAVLRARIAG